MKQIIITVTSYWTVPVDWSDTNSILLIGGGGGGSSYYYWIYSSVYYFGVRNVLNCGGAGAGAVSVTNLQNLVPGTQILTQVGSGGVGYTGGSHNGGGSLGGGGGTTSFGNIFTAYGGTTYLPSPYDYYQLYYGINEDSQIRPFGGSGKVTGGTYSSAYSSQGTIGTYGYGTPGYPTIPFSNYGQGGSADYEDAVGYVITPGQNGVQGVIVINYEPKVTYQNCVWIS